MTKLRVLRERLFITQTELAEAAGISLVTLNRLENNKQKPSFKTIRKLAKALGVEPGEIEF
ncbi:helix-turn-helix transcriptional regulator [Chloroflexota bacterium]